MSSENQTPGWELSQDENLQSLTSHNQPGKHVSLILDPLRRQILWGLFMLLYVPIFYYYGWLLPAGVGIDYPTYFHAARLVFLEGKTPYGLNAFNGLPGFTSEKVQPFLSLPPSLLVFWPLAKMSAGSAQALFLIASHLAYLGSVWLIVFRLTPLPRNDLLRDFTFIFSSVYCFRFDPALSTLGTGNITFITLLFMCLSLAALKKSAAPWRIALPLSLAIVLKTFPALLIFPLLFRKQYRALGLTGVYLAIITVISRFMLPPGIWHSWVVDLWPISGYANQQLPAAFPWNQSMNAFVMRLLQENYFSKAPLLHPALAKPLMVTIAVTILGVTVLSSYCASKKTDYECRKDDEVTAFLLIMFLLAPLAWDHHLTYGLPAARAAISLIFTGPLPRITITVLLCALLLMTWKLPLDDHAITQGWLTLLISAKMYPVVALWILFVSRMQRRATATVVV